MIERVKNRSKGKKPRTGKFLGIPYDWRRPTTARFKQRLWNRQAPLIVPHAYGWGFSINFGRLLGRKPRSRLRLPGR